MSAMQSLTNEYVQNTITEAVTSLKVSGTPEHLLIATLLAKTSKAYASGNTIPAGRGMGLEEIVALAEFYAAKDYAEELY